MLSGLPIRRPGGQLSSCRAGTRKLGQLDQQDACRLITEAHLQATTSHENQHTDAEDVALPLRITGPKADNFVEKDQSWYLAVLIQNRNEFNQRALFGTRQYCHQ